MQNPELELAFDFVQYTNRNIFLTGKAGTGKTTFLHRLREVSPKRMVVVAPTGVAAINAGGVTIHSFFQLPFGPILPGRLNVQEQSENRNRSFHRFNKRKINIIRSLDLLVIDEISMVRADLLDGIDHILRRFKDQRKPFGGAQLLMIGDLQQLAPVVKEDEWMLLREFYETYYFFSSKAFKQSGAISIELQHVYRQQDSNFIKILNEIRDNRLTEESINTLNKRHISGFRPENEEGTIILTTHNAIANRINEEQLQKLEADSHTFEARIQGKFPDYSFPADEFLTLKTGAQVMFIKNDSSYEKRYFNGKIGTITEIEDEVIYVQCSGEDHPIEVGTETWDNIRYTINEQSKEIEEELEGSFIQYPLRLAWAITIHKSQGLTFEKAVIDAKAAFAHGQTYVALSRCKSLEGLVLSTPFSTHGIICDPTVGKFNEDVKHNQPDDSALAKSKQKYMMELLNELFNYRQLQYHIEKGKKLVKENERIIIGDIGADLDKMLLAGTNTLNTVAQKFMGQLQQLILTAGSEKLLQERIRKGATYFYEQTALHLEKPLEQARFDTDNKILRKSIREVLDKISELLAVKQSCLNHCKGGFEIKDYLRIRAMAALEPLPQKKIEKPAVAITDSKHPLLYERVRAWRKIKAEEENLPHYRIISQRAVLGISNTLPGNNQQLLKVNGLGRRKLEKFGSEILEIVKDYCNENNLNAATAQTEEKKPKKETRRVSLELFKEGKTISQIAEIRQMAESTIEGHLAFFVGTGEVEVHQFVGKENFGKILDYYKDHPEALLSEAKNSLDEAITYGEIKFVRKYFERLAENK